MKLTAVVLLICLLSTASAVPPKQKFEQLFQKLSKFFKNKGKGAADRGVNFDGKDGTISWGGNSDDAVKFKVTDAALDELEKADYQEPAFTLTDDQPKSGKYEARIYPAAKWVCSDVTARFFQMASSTAFTRLFNYISGANDQGTKIEMTVPVSTFQRTPRCAFCPVTFTTCFYIPKEYQTNTPAPISKLVSVVSLGPMKVFARKFSKLGFGNEWKEEAGQLVQDITEEGQHTNQYRTDYFISSAYTNPVAFDKPRSEVWLVRN